MKPISSTTFSTMARKALSASRTSNTAIDWLDAIGCQAGPQGAPGGMLMDLPGPADASRAENDDKPRRRSVLMSELELSPPPPIEAGLLIPGKPVGLYARGEVGKGVYLSEVIARLDRDGRRVLVIDFEDNPDEWPFRLAGLGDPGILTRQRYINPAEAGLFGPIWDISRELREEAVDADYIFIDAVGRATSGHTLIDETTVKRYAEALSIITKGHERPVGSASVMHTPEAGDKPYGSMMWLYYFRLSWSFTDFPGRGKRLAMKKANAYAKVEPRNVSFRFEDDQPVEVKEAPWRESTADRVMFVVMQNPGVDRDGAYAALGAVRNGDPDAHRLWENVKRTITRMVEDGRLEDRAGSLRVAP